MSEIFLNDLNEWDLAPKQTIYHCFPDETITHNGHKGVVNEKTAVPPLLTHLRYCSPALRHRNSRFHGGMVAHTQFWLRIKPNDQHFEDKFLKINMRLKCSSVGTLSNKGYTKSVQVLWISKGIWKGTFHLKSRPTRTLYFHYRDKFVNGLVVSSHTLWWMLLLIHSMITVKPY